MKELPQISEAEWQVIKILWESDKPVSANEIIQKLESSTSWKPKTIKTLLSRLLKKNAISYKADNRTYYYYPIVKEEEIAKAETNSFLKKVYNGSLNLLVANFLKEEKLSMEEIEKLKSILDDNMKNEGGPNE